MKIITSKTELKPIAENAITMYRQYGMEAFVSIVHESVLKRKIKYPVLEFAAEAFYKAIDEESQVAILDKIVALKENGSEVIAGKILQLRLADQYDEAIRKGVDYIIEGDYWLPCDTVGERVFGHALLIMPEKTIPVLAELSKHTNKWIVRSVGVAVHYAVKKGLKKAYAEEMFTLLLSLATTTDFHTKKGIGWAAKTTAKFHPDIIAKYEDQVTNYTEIKQWFRSKITIGLSRTYKYANRYPG